MTGSPSDVESLPQTEKALPMSWFPRQSVVVPVDFSDSSPEAVRTGLELVDDPQRVHLLHVLVPLDAVSPGVKFGTVTDAAREQHVREHARKFFAAHGVPELPLELRIGHAAEEIVDYAAAVSADLIVVPSHGFHGVKRFVLGSVAEQVIRHAACPVLVLRRTDAQ